MVRRLLYTFILSNIYGQSLSVISDLDTNEAFVGEVIKWSITIDNIGDRKIGYPNLEIYTDSITLRDQNLLQENGKIFGIQFELMFWDTGLFNTPVYHIEVLNDSSDIEFSLQAPSLDIQINSILASNGENLLRPLLGPVPVKWVLPFKIILSWLLFFGLIIGMMWTWKKRKKIKYSNLNYPIIETPEERANGRINELNISGFSKEFYTSLSHISREYMETKYFVRALEMTTLEIIEHRNLFPIDDQKFEAWVSILQFSDMVKYAREIPNADQINSDLKDVKSLIYG